MKIKVHVQIAKKIKLQMSRLRLLVWDCVFTRFSVNCGIVRVYVWQQKKKKTNGVDRSGSDGLVPIIK